jgi:four helix bundle protein
VFHHEKLDVYRVAIEFVAWVGELLETPLAKCRLNAVDQLDRASTSIPLNVAEGNGKRTPKDRCRYLNTARGSALESAACLDVLVARKVLTSAEVEPGKRRLLRIVEMLTKLTHSVLAA